MIDLLANLPALLATLAGAVAVLWGLLRRERAKGRKEGEERVSRRAQAAAEGRKEKRDEVESDIYTGGAAAARDSLRKDWRD